MSLRLYCVIQGENIIFPVNPERDENVSDLKKRIQKERALGSLKGVDPHILELWKIKDSNPIPGKEEKTLVQRIGRLGPDFSKFADTLPALQTIHSIFPTEPLRGHVHIIVRILRTEHTAPLDHPAEIAHKEALKMARAAPSPSSIPTYMNQYKEEQEDHPIYNGRPGNRRGPPITIYHPVFAELKYMLTNLKKVVDDREIQRVDDTAKLVLASTSIYHTQTERGEAIYEHLAQVLEIDAFEENVKTIGDYGREVAEADFIFEQPIEDKAFESKAPVIFGELNNELGISGRCGPQNDLTLRKHLAAKKYDGLRNATCCPCITISIAGPYITIGGAIFADIFVAEAFTDFIYMGCQPFCNERTITLSRVFAAVAQAVGGLRRFYHELHSSATVDVGRLLPCPTYYDNKKPELPLVFDRRFDYKGREPDDYRRSLFCAKYGDKNVLVKFCETYHGEGHRIVAEAGFAPKLFFCDRIKGGAMMVIMEKLEARDAHYHFKLFVLPESVLEDIRSAISILHAVGLVFGDLRRSNILINKTGEGKVKALLIDFEWVGQEDQARYPPFLNESGRIAWAAGVGPHRVMKRDHDIEMIELLNAGSLKGKFK